MRRVRGGDIAMIFQEPMTSLNPVFTIGDQIERGHHRAPRGLQAGGCRACRRSARAGRHELPGAPRQAVPARAVGRHAAARHDRHGPLLPAQDAHRRRADHGPRRDRPGPDPGPHPLRPGGAGHGPHAHHPRPRRRGRDGRRGGRHVRRPHRRVRLRQGRLRLAQAPLHPGAPGIDALALPTRGAPAASSRAPCRTPSTCRPGCNFASALPAALRCLRVHDPLLGDPDEDTGSRVACWLWIACLAVGRPVRSGDRRAGPSTVQPPRRPACCPATGQPTGATAALLMPSSPRHERCYPPVPAAARSVRPERPPTRSSSPSRTSSSTSPSPPASCAARSAT